jgi:epsilon-lactone hydrolase
MSKQQRESLDGMLRHAPLDLGGEVEEQRRVFAEMMGAVPLPAGVRTQDGVLGGVPVVRIEVDGIDAIGTVLYFHGGAYAIGSAASAAGLAADLAGRASSRAISVDYSLAPEHPYPTAVHEGVAAYRALLESGEAASGIALAGESAGGGLVIAVVRAILAAGLPAPSGVYVASPWVDLTTAGASMVTKAAVDPSVTPAGLRRRALDYAPAESLGDSGVSPVFGDLRGFPPLLVQVGGNEVLLDDSVRLAARAAADGVAVTLDVTPDVPHVFVAFAALVDESDQALDRAGRFVRDALQRAAL